MKTLFRALILLLVSLWVGGLLFFPVVAWAAFTTLPDTHAAGGVVRLCLHSLHVEGLVSGGLLLALLAARLRAYGRIVLAPIAIVVVMLALTAFSQYAIMPRMEQDRIGVERSSGRPIDTAPPDDSRRVDFNRLHVASERVEEGVLVAGFLLIAMLAREPRSETRAPHPVPGPR